MRWKLVLLYALQYETTCLPKRGETKREGRGKTNETGTKKRTKTARNETKGGSKSGSKGQSEGRPEKHVIKCYRKRFTRRKYYYCDGRLSPAYEDRITKGPAMWGAGFLFWTL